MINILKKIGAGNRAFFIPAIVLAATLSGDRAWSQQPVDGDVDEAGTAIDTNSSGFADQNQQAQRSPAVILRQLRFEGNTLISDDTLAAVVDRYLGQAVSSADLESIRVLLSNHYVQQGYINSGALLPDQPVEDGRITYQIIEGQLSHVNIGDNKVLNDDFLRNRILRDNEAVLNVNSLRNNLVLLRENPNVENVHAELLPGENLGSALLQVNVVEQQPNTLALTLDNHSPTSIGEEHAALRYSNTSVFGGSEQLNISLAATEGLREAATGFELPLTDGDTALFVGARRSKADIVEEPFDSLNIYSETRSSHLGLRIPLARSPLWSDRLEIQLQRRLNRTDLLDRPFSFSSGFVNGEARVSALRISNNWRYTSGDNRLVAVRTQVNRGLDAMDSTINEGLPDSEFTSVVNQTIFLQRFFGGNHELLLRNDLQWSSDPLLSMEQFSLGGANSVRGYYENQIISDRGVFVSAEWRWKPSVDYNLWLSTFVDYAKGENVDRELAIENELTGIGFGLNWRWSDKSNFELIWSEGLTDIDEKQGSSLQEQGIHLFYTHNFRF